MTFQPLSRDLNCRHRNFLPRLMFARQSSFTITAQTHFQPPQSCKARLPRTKHEVVAVNMLEAVNKSAWSMLKGFSLKNDPTPIEKQETRNAATVACTCTRDMLPTTMCTISFAEFMFPRLACVERRDASVMSRFPFSPRSAGTRMKSSGMDWKTSQCWKSENN